MSGLEVTTGWYLALGAALFTVGGCGVLLRRNPLILLMCVELMLNGVNVSFVALARRLDDVGGQTVVLFVLVVAAAEVVVGLGLVVAVMRRTPDATADDLSSLRG
ncbi:MAG TPA: NADH-quinone oxidoreductase subunit NuoK [Acidimicrobiaceae bacterium]|nr:NADH-quinone oxidoreductase subunit NuoK [Acidimicrobiaceae bacterium]HCB36771.1 NADH-quinone oxidoreductase subunit NuoK [Acidimicrobiaceae bacterium]